MERPNPTGGAAGRKTESADLNRILADADPEHRKAVEEWRQEFKRYQRGERNCPTYPGSPDHLWGGWINAKHAANGSGSNVVDFHVAAIQRETGIDVESARILARYRNGRMFDLTRDKIVYAEALEERLAKEKAERVVSGNGSVDWDQRQRRNGGARYSEPPPHVKITATPHVWRDPSKIQPRDFLYGDDVVRRYVSGMVAVGGGGKTSEIMVEIAAMVTGRDLLGVKPKHPCRVWYINLEDPLDEIERRFAAIFKKLGITEQEL